MATDGSDSRGQPSNQYRGTEFDSDEIAGLLTELARSLHEDRDPDEVLQNVVHAAIELIPGVEEASISVVFDRKTVQSRHQDHYPLWSTSYRPGSGKDPAWKRPTKNTLSGYRT